jgi:hypothetical protein
MWFHHLLVAKSATVIAAAFYGEACLLICSPISTTAVQLALVSGQCNKVDLLASFVKFVGVSAINSSNFANSEGIGWTVIA